MKGRLHVTGGFWLMALGVWVLDPQLLLPTALAALLHELGHALALWALGRPPRSLRLNALGASLELGDGLSYPQELLSAAAGPAVSLLCAWLGAGSGHYLFAGVSLTLGLFNLLPVPPLDGGRIFGAACALLLPAPTALAVVRWTAVGTAGLALGLALAAFPRLGGVTLPLTALWLCWCALSAEIRP